SAFARCAAELALQQWLGLLSQQRRRPHPDHRCDSTAVGATLNPSARGLTKRLHERKQRGVRGGLFIRPVHPGVRPESRPYPVRVRDAVGPDFPVILRVSQWKQQDYAVRLADTPDLLHEWLGPLVAAGVDVLYCSQHRFWVPEFPEIDGAEGLNFAGWAKK